jgi:exopolyphosphatase/guanosine-5'-triphosphate,3'-diphosphate pyrophosphatase
MHGYVIPARASDGVLHATCRTVDPEMLSRIEMVNEAAGARCSPTSALVLENVVRIMKPRDIVISALGVREGLLYSELPAR